MEVCSCSAYMVRVCVCIHVCACVCVCTALLPTLHNQLNHALSPLPSYTNSVCSIQCRDFVYGRRHTPYTLTVVCVCAKDGPPAPLTPCAGHAGVAALAAPTHGYAGSPAAARCNPPPPVSHLDCPECSSAAVRAFPRRSQDARRRCRALSQAVDSTTGKGENGASPTRQGCTLPVLLHGLHERSWRTAPPSCCWRPLEDCGESPSHIGCFPVAVGNRNRIGLSHKKVHFAVHVALPQLS